MGIAGMEARKKKGPTLPKWMAVKNRHKALKTGNDFKPDILPAITKYDQALRDFDKLVIELEDLKTTVEVTLKFHDEAYKIVEGRADDIAKTAKKNTDAMRKDSDKLRKYASSKDLDPEGISSVYEKLHTAEQTRSADRKTAFDALRTTDDSIVERILTGSREFNKEATALIAKVEKLEKEARSYNVDVILILNDYEKIAERANHDDVVKSLEGLIRELGK